MSDDTPQLRVMLCVTHPANQNGYSKVGYELAKCMAARKDIALTIYGFQNFHQVGNHRTDFPSNVQVYDAWANEEPKSVGFGVKQIQEFVRLNRPDVVVLYNDLLVVTQLLSELREARAAGGTFKIIAYMDQVYLCQRKDFIAQVNRDADLAMLFTPFWEDVAKGLGITLPTCHLPHGFNRMAYFPVDRALARRFYNLRPEDFIVLNLNRNQPRKRWDICLQAFAEVLKTHAGQPIKLLIATAVHGAWNLLEIFERELQKRGMTLAEGMKHVIVLDNPQRLSDQDINVLYNAADIGINTCDGEGFGLCNFEQGGAGVPQVVPDIGGFKDFFDDKSAKMPTPVMTYYVDTSRDAVGGEAQLCDYRDYARAIIEYYEDAALRAAHGRAARARVLAPKYDWTTLSDKLCRICWEVHRGNAAIEDTMATATTVTTAAAVVSTPRKHKYKNRRFTAIGKRSTKLKELKRQLDKLMLHEQESDQE